MIDKLFVNDSIIIKLDDTTERESGDFLTRLFSKNYERDYPCPKCGSHNVDIDIDALGDGYVSGLEWCNDCKWELKINTFPKK